MKTICSVCLVLALVSTVVCAQSPAPPLGSTLRTLDQKTYTEVKLVEVEADGIRIAHSTGVAKIPMGQLPEEARKYFADEMTKKASMQTRINASRHGEQERVATEKEIAAAEARSKGVWRPETLRLTVLEVRPDGVVAKREVTDAALASLPVFVEGVAGKPKGQMWMARVTRAGTWRNESRTLPKYRLAN